MSPTPTRILLLFALLHTTLASTAQTQNALDFDGIDDLVRAPGVSALLVGASSYSLTCWVNPRNAAPNYPDFDGFAGFRNEVDADFYLLQIAPYNVIEGRFQNSNEEVFTVTYDGLELDTWQHVGLVYNGSTLAIWYNGEEVSFVPANGGIVDGSVPFYMGNVQFQEVPFLLDGQLDEVALFSRALTASEMDCIVSSGPSLTDSDLEMYYRCDQGIPAGNNTALTTLLDVAGNSDGNLEGFALTGPSSNFVQGTVLGATTIEDVWCDGDTGYDFGGQVLTAPGTYTATFTSSSGCDSTVVLNLFQGEVNTAVVQNGNTLIATATDATWQWVDCDNSNAPIPGATSQYYQASAVGSYAVLVTQGCTAMSACFDVATIGIEELLVPLFSLSPVPVAHILNVELARPAQNATLRIVDMTGREVLQRTFGSSRKVALDVSALHPGAYFVRVQADGTARVLRFVRE